MSNDSQYIRRLKRHIDKLTFQLLELDPNAHIPLLNISMNSQMTNTLNEEFSCQYLYHKSKPAILHSTANSEYRQKPYKFSPILSARATSTPKSSPQQERFSLKPHQTSTPRRSKRHSTAFAAPSNNIIPLKRLLYKKKKRDQHKRRHSADPFSKRSILPLLHPIDENQQWI